MPSGVYKCVKLYLIAGGTLVKFVLSKQMFISMFSQRPFPAHKYFGTEGNS